MEIVKDNNNDDITVYINDIDETLHNFFLQFLPDTDKADPQKLDDYITSVNQNRFNAALMYTGNNLFRGTKNLKAKAYTYNENNHIYTNNNKLDYEKLNCIADYYIYICSNYDKVVSFYGFSYLCGIDVNTVIGWNNPDRYRVSKDGIRIYQKLLAASEQSLSGMLTGKRNPVGVLGILNHLHSWSMPGVSHERVDKRSLTAADLPKLGNMHNDAAAPGIEDKNENVDKA